MGDDLRDHRVELGRDTIAGFDAGIACALDLIPRDRQKLAATLHCNYSKSAVMQVRKEELLPQHWQVIGDRTVPDRQIFESYPEIRGLRAVSAHSGAARGQTEALYIGWQELAGKQPALWTTSDLFVVVRRIIQRDLPVDFNELLSAIRDVWRGLSLPHGKDQLETLRACLDLIRQKTKK